MEEDPRIDELLAHMDDVDEKGEPTLLALIARRVDSYEESIEKLREELEGYHGAVSSLETRAQNLAASISERDSIRVDLTSEAQEYAVRAAMSASSSRGAALRNEAEEKRTRLRQFEEEQSRDTRRLRETTRALEASSEKLTATRDQIARRMNIIDSLLQRAEIEWPNYYLDEAKKNKAQGSVAQPRRRRRGRGRRITIRRPRNAA